MGAFPSQCQPQRVICPVCAESIRVDSPTFRPCPYCGAMGHQACIVNHIVASHRDMIDVEIDDEGRSWVTFH